MGLAATSLEPSPAPAVGSADWTLPFPSCRMPVVDAPFSHHGNPGIERLRITILTPTLDAAQFLPECLASIRAQGWPRERLQHLVLDGKSKDATVAIAREAGAEVDEEKDSSLYEAMNRGVRLATGDVIGWLNADDTLSPGALATIAAPFERDPGLDLVVGDCSIEWPDRKHVHRGSAGALSEIRRGSRRNQWVIPLATWFRAATLRRLGPYDLRYRLAADRDLWFRAANAVPPLRVAAANRVLGTFRVHAGSLSSIRSLTATREEIKAVCSAWIDDPAAADGVRRHARYLSRCEDFALRQEREAPASPGARLLWTLGEVTRRLSSGSDSAWDVRELAWSSAQEATVGLAKRMLGRAVSRGPGRKE